MNFKKVIFLVLMSSAAYGQRINSNVSMGMDSTSISPVDYSRLINTVSTGGTGAVTPVNGICGSDDGTLQYSPPIATCRSGEASPVYGYGVWNTWLDGGGSVHFTNSPWTWTCSGINGGNSTSCSSKKIVNGVCANNTTPTNRPPAILCDFGTVSPATLNSSNEWTWASSTPQLVGSRWVWTCYGINRGSNASCSSPSQ
jgi:hypothetical protein